AKTRNVRVQLNNNALVEFAETVELRIVAADSPVDDLGDYYRRHADGSRATLTVADDDAAAAKIAIGTSASLRAGYTASVGEAAGSLNVPVTVSHLPVSDTTFDVEVLSGTATEGTDFSIGTKSVTFADTGAKTRNVIITLTDDEWVEDDQTVVVRIVAADAVADDLGDFYARDEAEAGTDSDGISDMATVTIEDDEQRAARIAFGESAVSTTQHTFMVAEDVAAGNVTVPVTINFLPESSQTFVVEYLSSSTASSPDDYNGGGFVTFGPTDTTKTQNITISITDDDLVENDQTIAIRVVAAADPVAALGDYYVRHASGATSLGTILDDDARAAKIAFGSSSDAVIVHRDTVEEPDSGTTTLNVPVTLSHLPESSTTFGVRVTTGTAAATDNTDYSVAKTITFGPGESASKDLVVTVNADAPREGNETISLQLSAADGVADTVTHDDLGDYYDRDSESSKAGVIVTDPDSPLNLEVVLRLNDATANSPATIPEGQGTVEVRAFLGSGNEAPAGGVRVMLLPAEGTTMATTEYRLGGAFTIREGQEFALGRVRFVDDQVKEDTEDLVLSAATSP
ncbi:MAG: hypothetical protein OXB92_17150, partial [Acidimicrobiaceae bacterium]|nr:hypothetical protein [Acidimicrobiaceae bacterium]